MIKRQNNQPLSSLLGTLPKSEVIHNLETGQYMRVIMRVMGYADKEKKMMWQGESALDYHDIGKALLPIELLDYNDLFNERQRRQWREHTIRGAEVFDQFEAEHPGAEGFCEFGRMFAMYHHECYDGSGYPKGLRGNEIPTIARIGAVANTYAALRRGSFMHMPQSFENSMIYIKKHSGIWYDPEIVDAFLSESLRALSDKETERLIDVLSKKIS